MDGQQKRVQEQEKANMKTKNDPYKMMAASKLLYDAGLFDAEALRAVEMMKRMNSPESVRTSNLITWRHTLKTADGTKTEILVTGLEAMSDKERKEVCAAVEEFNASVIEEYGEFTPETCRNYIEANI
jgi:hypothetical protein